jgi:hypothetical protein
MNGDAEAVREMVVYNQQDVVLLEEVFHKLKPYCTNLLNLALVVPEDPDGPVCCPRTGCGSTKVQSRGVHKAITRVYRRFQCMTCGGWFRSATNEKDIKPSTKVL